jgi:phosphomethylpyrimidine synthase
MDNEKKALEGMQEMSEKFNAMGQQVYVDAEKVKEADKAL